MVEKATLYLEIKINKKNSKSPSKQHDNSHQAYTIFHVGGKLKSYNYCQNQSRNKKCHERGIDLVLLFQIYCKI